MNKHISSSGTIKKCSIILNKVTKKTLILLDVYVLKIGEYDSSYILGYSPVLTGIFGHLMHLNQSGASKNI